MSSALASEFNDISYLDYPFPPDVTEIESLYYLKDIEPTQFKFL
jgi:hypothetical protein